MSIGGLLIGLLTILLWGLVLALIVYAVIWVCNKFFGGIDGRIQNILWAIVGVILLILLISMLLGTGPYVPALRW